MPLWVRDVRLLTLDEPILTDTRSDDVTLPDGQRLFLVHVRSVTFNLANGLHLTGTIRGSVLTAYTVDYDIHVAVFDLEGSLLGTAKATYEIEKQEMFWYGAPFRLIRELNLDFGMSSKYRKATFFAIAISKPDMLSPRVSNLEN